MIDQIRENFVGDATTDLICLIAMAILAVVLLGAAWYWRNEL